jgi:hypothetical protein
MAAKVAGTWAVTEPAGIEALTTFGTTQLHKLGRRCKAETGAAALALGACVASNYGWFQILGRGVATSNTTIVDGTQAYICGTAGMIDDAVLAGDAIVGMIISSTTDTATCVVNMTTYPVVSDMNAT